MVGGDVGALRFLSSGGAGPARLQPVVPPGRRRGLSRKEHGAGISLPWPTICRPERPFILAGHDWGASIAYAYAFACPGRLTHLIVANGVHPVPFQRAILDDPAQRKASQYINLFREPDAEAWLSDNEFAAMFNMLAGFSDTGWMRKAQHSAYVEAWSRPGAMKAMLDWYRASPLIVPEPGEAALLGADP